LKRKMGGQKRGERVCAEERVVKRPSDKHDYVEKNVVDKTIIRDQGIVDVVPESEP